jgi:hypothetical protein
MRQVVSGSQTNAGKGAVAPVVTTAAGEVPSDPAVQSAMPPLRQAALATGGKAQVRSNFIRKQFHFYTYGSPMVSKDFSTLLKCCSFCSCSTAGRWGGPRRRPDADTLCRVHAESAGVGTIPGAEGLSALLPDGRPERHSV